MNAETTQFAKDQGLEAGIDWLIAAVPEVFGDCPFEIRVEPHTEAGETPMLFLCIFDSLLSFHEFRKLRHALSEKIRDADHDKLYMLISIFRRHTVSFGKPKEASTKNQHGE